MADEIKGMFVKDNVLHLVRGADVWSFTAEEGKEPSEWQKVHFANVGMNEEFVEVFTELQELMGASRIHGAEREAAKSAIMAVVTEGLMPAFEHLRKIRASVSLSMAELNRQQMYEDFAVALWRAYKNRFQKATLTLGFNIGFVFTQDAVFEKGLVDFTTRAPSLILDVPELLRRQRANWQKGLADFRNDLEHSEKDVVTFAAYYQPKTAEMLFDHAWRTMAELLPAFIEARYGPSSTIREIPTEQRDPRRSRRWRHDLCEPIERGNFPM